MRLLQMMILATLLFCLASCQSSRDVLLSEQDASDVIAKFKKTSFVAPRRSIVDVKNLFGAPRPVPLDCNDKIQERDEGFRDHIFSIGNEPIEIGLRTSIQRAQYGGALLRNEFERGKFENVVSYIDRVINQPI